MIWSIITDLLAPFWPYIAGALAIVGGWFVAKRQGAKGERAKQAVKDAKAFQKTTERMQDAEAAMGDDPAVLRDRLRNRDPDQR